MKISLATNFDNDLIDQIKEYPVYEIYGKLKNDIIGGGRPDNELMKIEKETFEKHVKKVRDSGIKFNYLLNGSCLANVEQDLIWQNKFNEFLCYLKQIGVNALTVTNPFILMYVKKHFKDNFTIRISTFACIDSYEKAKFWEEMGADLICVDFVKINRDFQTLKYMNDNLKTVKIELLMTNSCLKNCPMIHTHTNALSHASNEDNNKEYQDWGLFFCQKKELFDIEEYIKSPWIRPEDLHYYEEIGIEHFKITERGFPTSELVKRVKAYAEGKYEGNLLDLIQGHGVVEATNLKLTKKNIETTSEIYDEIKRIRGLGCPRTANRHIYIDNKKLEGFIKFFINGNCHNQCDKCNYCKKVSENVITKDEEVCKYLEELYTKFDNKKM